MSNNDTIKQLNKVLEHLGNDLMSATQSEEEYREVADMFGAVQNALTVISAVENAYKLIERETTSA